jgi:hypothetical protein
MKQKLAALSGGHFDDEVADMADTEDEGDE